MDDLIGLINEEERILRERIPYVRPRFAQAFWRHACLNRIDKYKNYLQIKSITTALPRWEKLKREPELLEEILLSDRVKE